MSNLFDYSTTAASNNSAAPNGAPEGMTPSGVNDTIRQLMANAAGAFTCYTGGGTSSAMTVTMSPTLAAYSNKVRIAFIPPANNAAGGVTLAVNGLAATAIKMLDGNDPPAGALNSSGVSVVQHDGTNFKLLNSAVLAIGGVLVTSTAAELNILDGVTSTAAELNKTDDSAAAVSGYVSGMRTYLSEAGGETTGFDVDTNVTENTFESVGPTGSSATNIWTAMDSIPAGARIAIIRAELEASCVSTLLLEVWARMTGNSQAAGDSNHVSKITIDGATGLATVEEFHVPLDSSRRFDITWNQTSASTQNINIYLAGFVL